MKILSKLIFVFVIEFCLSHINIYSQQNHIEVANLLNKKLKAINMLAVDFTEIDSKNNITKGKMLIQKPLKFRINYYPPFPLMIVGNKNYITIYDFEFNSFTRIKSSENILGFLVENNSEFLESFSIINSWKKEIEKIKYYKISLLHKISNKKFDIYFNYTIHIDSKS